MPTPRSSVIVRAVETRGAGAHAEVQLPFVGRTLTADFGPFQVRTFRVPADAAQDIVEVDLLEWALDAPVP